MSTADPAVPASLSRTILKAVWWSILLGLAVQALIVLATTFNKATILQDTVGRVTWSALVCTAIAVGNAISKMRPAFMGVLGLLAAPAAFVVAKAVQKSVSQGAASGPPVPTGLEIAIVRGLEYAALGAILAWMGRSPARAHIRNFILTGLAIGLIFGGYLVYRFVTGNDPRPRSTGIIARCINEFAFPLGCSVVLWAAGHLGAQLGSTQSSSRPRN
jgi:hypothetical protein